MEQRLSILTLGVSDLQNSRRFYEALGWTVATEEGAENIVAFNLNSFVLALYPLEKFSEEFGRDPGPVSNSFTLAYNVGSENLVDTTIEHAVEIAGAKLVKAPEKVFWGGYSGYFSDPDGYMWEVAFNPFSQPNADGSFKWV